MTEKEVLPFKFEKDTHKHIIKVIGVGGGGGNAVVNMYKKGIHDVSFALCNTDAQALSNSDIPTRIQLGISGLGAGNKPEHARDDAENSIEALRNLFTDGTQMAFITAGMGGGTGTGASPVIAREARAAGVLTVGIVTIPFLFEQQPKIVQALQGVKGIKEYVDALLVINNEQLLRIYREETVDSSFAIADEILFTAVKSIAELITVRGVINLDFNDVKSILEDGGIALMSFGIGKENDKNRLETAIKAALHSPLLNDNDVNNASRILFNIYQSSKKPLLMKEVDALTEFMNSFRNKKIQVIWGLANDDSLDGDVKITILATGFSGRTVHELSGVSDGRSEGDTQQDSALHINIDMGPTKAPTVETPAVSAASPEPAVSPQPATISPQPATVSPQPATISPQPAAVSPQPATINPQPAAVNPQPAAVNPQPAQKEPEESTPRQMYHPAAVEVVPAYIEETAAPEEKFVAPEPAPMPQVETPVLTPTPAPLPPSETVVTTAKGGYGVFDGTDNETMIAKIYGLDKYQCFLFGDEDSLANDQLIAEVIESPTYRRKPVELDRLNGYLRQQK